MGVIASKIYWLVLQIVQIAGAIVEYCTVQLQAFNEIPIDFD